ncbi:AGE family epimerase/isomerase [Lutimonas zeaxanthinifaciens]|uniref:AGE family epimerase/isomerase n=1 Tax=Lutimonas zeaxanthinifaciens TaxID=3060215 RepID=UPI00265D0539|nr:AGE family epimerase/isomerase [Lutimonas sp. YSD2104]WKK66430.1 AGE family epimerase/isomerase [Lutimonas sp. YSD2104]
MEKVTLTSIEKEFRNYMEFWNNNMINKEGSLICPEISLSGTCNWKAEMGSMYLSRVLYGSSKAYQLLGANEHKDLAALAFKLLMEFKNPLGGYYWSRTYNMQWKSDAENVNMAQAFVLYGLAEYEKVNGTPEVKNLVDEQVSFINEKLIATDLEGFIDGLDEEWERGETITRSFATHFHTMEALVKVYENRNEEQIKQQIIRLLHIIMDRFIDRKSYFCMHRFTEDWAPLPDENWAGHNAECSWVICEAAKAIDDKEFINKTETMALLMMERVIKEARDETNGGYFNIFNAQGDPEKIKSWWPQAEVVLGLMNAYKISSENRYKELAEEQISYIQSKFIDKRGEWIASLHEKGAPDPGTPLIFFWKSMYHTVRYYDYLLA